MKILKRVLWGLLIVLIVAFGGVFIYMQTLKPTLSGQVRLEGLTTDVEVYFDPWGVPHIYAENEEDAYYAFGYIHAQDRLFQMEMLRRASSGRLSEVLGPELLEVDKLFRTLGLNKFARQHSEKYLSADTAGYQRAVHAYLKGINAFIREGATPIEFSVIGIPKTEFIAEDVYYVIGFMALGFAEGFEADPVLQKIKTEFGSEYLKDLAINTPPDAAVIPVHNGRAVGDSSALISAMHRAFTKLPVPLLQGSNGWVVSSRRSASGFPILANDTHIGFSQPAVWYEAHIEYPGFSLYGHHLAGLPFGILGNNRFCGWGITMFENDDVDFFLETPNPENPGQVKFKDEWENLTIRKEIIHIKGQEDHVLQVRESRHGPIINGIIDPVDGQDPVALSWLLLLQDNQALEAAYQLGKAGTFEDAQKAVSLFSAPGLNLMYGDVSGNIAWWAAARLPIRPDHVQSKLFLDGASGMDEYEGYYDFSQNPKSINPPEGFVYSANNQPDSVEGVLYPGYYFPKSRAGRIVELLQGDAKLSSDDIRRINLDHVSHMHAEIAHTIGKLAQKTPRSDESSLLIKHLQTWDGTHDKDAVAPAVYYQVLAQLLSLVLQDEIGAEAYDILLKTALLKNSMHPLISNEQSPWWDDVTTEGKVESRQDILEKALENALAKLRETCGENPEAWKWGKIHTLTHNHALGKVKPLDRFFDVGPFPVSGGSEVINNLDFRYQASGYFPVGSGPALRKITDFKNIEEGVTVSPTGQSGNIMSPHYSDQAEMFVEGTFRAMLMNRDQIIAQSKNKLIFKP